MRINTYSRLLATIGLTCISAATLADEALLKRLRESYPATYFETVDPSPIDGVYEVVVGDKRKDIAYTDQSGRYLLFGNVVDMLAQADMTTPKRAALADRERYPFPTERLKNAIKVVRGSGERQVAVFADPHCDYCKRLEGELSKLDNVTIYTFLYPILGEESRSMAIKIWCAPQRADAWQAWMLSGVQPAMAVCPSPLPENLRLGESYGVQGTPTLIASDGRVLRGMAPAERLNVWIGGVR